MRYQRDFCVNLFYIEEISIRPKFTLPKHVLLKSTFHEIIKFQFPPVFSLTSISTSFFTPGSKNQERLARIDVNEQRKLVILTDERVNFDMLEKLIIIIFLYIIINF